jgi:hypothetical protein
MGSILCSYCCFLFKNCTYIKERGERGGAFNPNSMLFLFFGGAIVKGSSIYMIRKSSIP